MGFAYLMPSSFAEGGGEQPCTTVCAVSEILSSVELCDLCFRLKDPDAFNWWLYDPWLWYGTR